MVAYGGSIYVAANDAGGNPYLYRVNPVDGSSTFVGDPGIYWDYSAFGSTTSGLYSVGGAGTAAELFSINPTTGAATDIGPTGKGMGYALSSNSDTLYYSWVSSLYTINTQTGLASLVGDFGGDVRMRTLLVVDGTLYGVDWSHNTISTIDTSTGLATVLSHIDGATPWGLAAGPEPDSAAPEPGSAFLLMAGVAGLIVAKRKIGNPRTSPTR
jgi:hypothetical protein